MYQDVGMEHGNNDNCIIVTDPRENISPHKLTTKTTWKE